MEAKRHIEPHQATFLMVGCKKDLARTEREVPKETAQVVNTKIFFSISMKNISLGIIIVGLGRLPWNSIP